MGVCVLVTVVVIVFSWTRQNACTRCRWRSWKRERLSCRWRRTAWWRHNKPCMWPSTCCYYSTPSRGVEYCDEHVFSVSVRLSLCEYISGNTCPTFTKIFVLATYGRDSLHLWQHYNMLHTFGFMDDEYLYILGHMEACQDCCSEWCHSVVVHRLLPVLCHIGCVMS